MQLTNTTITAMDIHMLMSILNLKLRNDYPSFLALCLGLELDEKTLAARLSKADYHYDAVHNQFR